MELTAEEPWMLVAGQLDDLDETLVSRRAAEHQPAFFQSLTKCRIEFVTMPVGLADLFRAAIYLTRERTFLKMTRPGAQTHRATHFFHIDQIAKLKDDWIRCLDVELSRFCVFQMARVAGEFDARGLHAETNPEIRRARPARV